MWCASYLSAGAYNCQQFHVLLRGAEKKIQVDEDEEREQATKGDEL